MTGRRLYDKFCDATAKEFSPKRGAWLGAIEPLPAWPSLSVRSRARWNALAHAITPRPRKGNR